MSMDLSNTLVDSVTEQRDTARPPASDAQTTHEVRPHDPRPLDWGHAVDLAVARLEESWVRPDGTGHMLSSGLADEFAATLCAFGMVAEEVVHMHAHADKRVAEAERTPRETHE
jgi:hypothetical protein